MKKRLRSEVAEQRLFESLSSTVDDEQAQTLANLFEAAVSEALERFNSHSLGDDAEALDDDDLEAAVDNTLARAIKERE